ncbi:MAG: FMN-binding protein [Coriobacteriales bacterium]|jgi:uncharacterized protein with FMN-binding domain/ferredoxin
MEQLTRRSFLGALGAAAAIPVINVAGTEGRASASEKGSSAADADGAVAGKDLSDLSQSELLALVKDTPVAEEDLTLPDGTVIDKAYVTLRNRLNRIGEGFGGTPGVHGYDFFTSFWTVEEAQAENDMPLLQWFTAYDFACTSDRELDEATELCDRLADKRLLMRVNRGGTNYYHIIGGLWGIRSATRFREFTKQFLIDRGVVGGIDDQESQYPILGVCPVSPDVVEGGKVAPYRDWRGILERSTVVGVAPCGCRNASITTGAIEENDNYHGILHCVVVGETAQFMIDTGNATQISTEEALDIYDQAIQDGFVPEVSFSQHPEVFCLCKSDTCRVLGVYRQANGETSKFPNASAYVLSYDRDKCIKCGACVDRCPMAAVSFGDDGYVQLGPTCVGCGQCVLTCPASARILRQKDEVPALPLDLIDQMAWEACDRMATVGIHDFVGSEIPAESVEKTQDALSAFDDVPFLIDQKPSGGADSYNDGTYEANVNSIGGPMTVDVEISGGKIAHVTVVSDNDTPSIGDVAMRTIADEIVEANGLDVDTVSMATHSSIALMRAVEQCLRDAGWDGNE